MCNVINDIVSAILCLSLGLKVGLFFVLCIMDIVD